MQIIPKWVEPPTCLKDCFRNYKNLYKLLHGGNPELIHKDVLETLFWMARHRPEIAKEYKPSDIPGENFTELVWDLIVLACQTYTREEL